MADKEEQIKYGQAQPTEQEQIAELTPEAEQPTEQAQPCDKPTAETENGSAVADAKRRSKTEIAVNVALWVAIIVLLITVVLRFFVFNTVAVSGDSMLPTYKSGKVITVNKVRKPKRGDVVVFYKYDIDSKLKAMFARPEQSGKNQPYELLIKRVIATEGDKIWVRKIVEEEDSYVYEVVVDTSDGKRVYEDYYVKDGETLSKFTISSQTRAGLGNLAGHTEDNPLVIKKGCMYVMGDNRPVSDDSRGELGQVPLSRLFGVMINQ